MDTTLHLDFDEIEREILYSKAIDLYTTALRTWPTQKEIEVIMKHIKEVGIWEGKKTIEILFPYKFAKQHPPTTM